MCPVQSINQNSQTNLYFINNINNNSDMLYYTWYIILTIELSIILTNYII